MRRPFSEQGEISMRRRACFAVLSRICAPISIASGDSTVAILWFQSARIRATPIRRKNRGLVLILLSIMMLLVGGGLFPPGFGVIARIVGTRIKQLPRTGTNGIIEDRRVRKRQEWF